MEKDLNLWFADLEAFLHVLRDVNEPDYGDFMRQANMHLDSLREQLEGLDLADKDWYSAKLLGIQEYLQFSPDWNLATTRPRIFADLRELWKHAKAMAGVSDRDVEAFPDELTVGNP